MDFSAVHSFKIWSPTVKKPLAVFLTLLSPTHGASPSLDQECHALRTELAQVYEKIARLEQKAREAQSAPAASTAYVRPTPQTQDEEDQLFHSPEPQDQPENDPENQTTEPRTLSIDGLIDGNTPFSTMPVPAGWVVGTVTTSALVPTVGQEPSRHAPLPKTSVPQAKKLLEKREMLGARHMLTELARNHGAADHPFALYWLGMLDLHENRLDSAFALFSNIYDHGNSNPNSDIQQLCVAALLRMAQTRLRQNQIVQAKNHFEHCQKMAKSITVPLPRHILYGIRKMRATLRTEMKALKKAPEQTPAPEIPVLAPSTESNQPLSKRPVSGPTLSDGSEHPPAPFLPSDEDASY
jgi:hypothetical protein